jgi:sulfate-transporting ATPase
MSHFICTLKEVSKVINNKVLIKETSLSFIHGAKIGIIGQNGSGKSTLMKMIAGVDKDFNGEIWHSKDLKVGYLEQEPKLDVTKTVYENILFSLADRKKLLDDFNNISERLGSADESEFDELLSVQANLQEQIEQTNSWNLEHEIEIAMDALCCPAKTRDVVSISGGEKRRVALCMLLLQKPGLLLLDEPTNHLDANSVAWLENYLANYPGTIIMITHDRYFLDNIAEWVLEIENNTCIPWKCNYSGWLQKKQEKLQNQKSKDDALDKQIQKELSWIKAGKHTRNKARVKAYYNLIEQKQDISGLSSGQIIIPNGPRLGDLVIELKEISKKFGDKVLFDKFSCVIPPGAIVGVIGQNGSGKSTLMNIISGKEKPDEGEINIGATVKLGYVDQSRDTLLAEKTVWEEISSGQEEMHLGDKVIKTRAYCSCFSFKGESQQKKVKDLSGGERNRVHMAKLLKSGANVILLDEPSNDLDVQTLRNLEEAIESFVGCCIIVSHDRWFLDRLATHLIIFNNKDNSVLWFEGNYSEYEKYYEISQDSSKKNVRKKISI